MARLAASLAVILLPLLASAHFKLLAPESIGFDDEKESTGPCGGFTPDLSSDTSTDFHVGGDAIALQLGHPEANWLIRGTLDTTASGNWTELFPIVQQVGLGYFCEPAVSFPESWVGKKGIVSVVADAPDGLLYQCAAVTFVSGKPDSTSSDCKNASVKASFVSDDKLTALLGGSPSSGSSSSSAAASSGAASATSSSSASSSTASSSTASSSSSSSASASATGNAAAQLPAPMSGGFVGSVLTAASMVLLGAAFIL